MKIDLTEEQKLKLKGHIKLLQEAEKIGIDFDLFEFLEKISPSDTCPGGPFVLISQNGDIQTYKYEKCSSVFIRKASIKDKG